jgi:hypothetical protein
MADRALPRRSYGGRSSRDEGRLAGPRMLFRRRTRLGRLPATRPDHRPDRHGYPPRNIHRSIDRHMAMSLGATASTPFSGSSLASAEVRREERPGG